VPNVHLTQIGLQNLAAPEKGQVDYWDSVLPCFGVRVSQGGSKTFVLKVHNSRRKIGRFPILTLGDARAEAKRLLAEKTLGKLRPQSVSFSTARDAFIAEKEERRKASTAGEYRRLLGRLPFKGQLSEITHAEFSRALARFKSPSERQHILVASRVFFNWCARKRYITENPTFGIEGKKSPNRTRTLTDAELKAIWAACEQDDESLPTSYAIIVKLLMVTGQRRGEISALRTSYVDGDTATLPPELTKNKLEHIFPLGPVATDILRDVRTNGEQNDAFYFPARGKPDKSFNGWSKGKKAFDKVCGVKGWTLHDLRRTYRTNHAKIGTPPHIAERLVNHISAQTEMERVYDIYKYLPEMRAAQETYEAYLFRIVSSPEQNIAVA